MDEWRQMLVYWLNSERKTLKFKLSSLIYLIEPQWEIYFNADTQCSWGHALTFHSFHNSTELNLFILVQFLMLL